MTFFRTEMLFLIWVVPGLFLAIVYGMRRRREIMSRFASAHGLGVIAPEAVGRRRWLKGSLLMATVLFTVLALSGPKYGYRWQEIRQEGVDIIIALDCSRSMTVTDIQPTRLERAKREVFDLLAMLEGDRVGLVAFAGTAFLQCPLTLDYDAFNLFLNALSADYLPVGGTDITGALAAALNSFDPKSASDKAVILITDGENTGDGDPVKAAESLKERSIKLFCIGVGGNDGVPIPAPDGGFKKDRAGQIVLSRLDEHTLKQMALVTGGTYVRSVAGDMDLDAIYMDEIRTKMEAQTLLSGRKQVWEDRFQWPLAVALLCLAAELLLPVTRKGIIALLAAALLLPLPAAQANDTRDGMAAYEKGDFDKALKHFTDAQLQDPEKPQLLFNVADAYYKTGNFDAAAEHYKQALETDDTQLKRKALYNLGNAEFRRGKAKEAIARYEAALAIDPDDRLTKENLAFVRQALEQQKQEQSSDKNDQDRKDDQEQKQENQNRQSQSSPEGEQDPQQQKEQTPNEAPHEPQGQQQPQFGNEMDKDRQRELAGTPQQDEPSANQQAAAQSRPDQPEDRTGDPGQAERMLNRLQDQPGRALMPDTGRRAVEKDW